MNGKLIKSVQSAVSTAWCSAFCELIADELMLQIADISEARRMLDFIFLLKYSLRSKSDVSIFAISYVKHCMHHADRNCACRSGRAAAIAGSTGESAKVKLHHGATNGGEKRTQGCKEGRSQGCKEGRSEEGRSKKAPLAVGQNNWLN
jgi:hypothetical protein